MNFQDISLKRRYKTYKDNIIQDFYIPTLEQSKIYKRAVGFFSSSALIELSKGISGLIANDGYIQLIVSPKLETEDIIAINDGYKVKNIINHAINRGFKEPTNPIDLERLTWIGHLIATNHLDIKVAFTKNISNGMYHEKNGILIDGFGNKIAFEGSMNETSNAFHNNGESIIVFKSWDSIQNEYLKEIENSFDSLWNGTEENLEIMDFPQALYEKLKSYNKEVLNLSLDKEPFKVIPDIPNIPNIELYDYQKEAINQWERQGFQGIFDMATGTGKTLTGLGAVVRLYQKKRRFFLLIVCPYTHLIEQWVEDIKRFNINPIVGYSQSSQTDWKKKLKDNINYFNEHIIDFKCFITTNKSFISKDIRSILKYLKREVFLLVDEVHNFGSTELQKTLDVNYKYRLGLSATLERHNDASGTQKLLGYFGKKCIEYNIERAIKEDKLTRYYYYPVVVYLTDNELIEYNKLSEKIAKSITYDMHGIKKLSDYGKMLLIKRSRIVAGAYNKLDKLKKIMLENNYTNDTHMLVYCGSTTIDNGSTNDEKQILAVCKMLGNDLSMKVTKFTSKENATERQRIKKGFINAEPYQVIVAIKCLDEGVNIPSIKTAFILASTTNPKEYIQRRGRVLRKSSNKEFSYIWDFITLPRELSTLHLDNQETKYDISLVKKEIARMEEFGRISENPSQMDKLKSKLVETYGLDKFDFSKEDLYEY